MALIIYLIPIWWLIGLKPIILQLTILVISLNYFLNYGIKFNLISMMLLLYSNIYIASILYNLPEMPFGRAVGSFANCSLWISGGLIIIYINNLYSFKKVFTISKSLIYILLISSLIAIYGLLTFYTGDHIVTIASPALKYFPTFILANSEIIRDSLTVQVVRPDFNIFGVTPRSSGLYEYPNALAIGVIAVIPFSLNSNLIKSFYLRIFVVCIFVLTLVLSGSRATIAGFIISLLIIKYVHQLISYRSGMFTKIIGLIFLAVMAWWFFLSITILFDLISSFRPGSTRTNIFLDSLSNFYNSNNVFLGMGFKPRADLFSHPTGSHSTLFGVLMKTGLLGFAIYFTIILIIINKIFKVLRSLKCYTGYMPIFLHCVCMLTSIMWMVVEDIDAPPLAAFSYFISLGIFMLPEKYLFSFYNSTPKQIKFI